jgi:hypothetical protein
MRSRGRDLDTKMEGNPEEYMNFSVCPRTSQEYPKVIDKQTNSSGIQKGHKCKTK